MNNLIKYAELFKMLCNKYNKDELGKKVTQKIFYFFERNGINLNLKYGIHYYGPYSAKLDDAMHVLESEDYISIDITGATHIISSGSTEIEKSDLTEKEKEIAESVLEEFVTKSSYELEALATMDYVATSILPSEASEVDIIEKFKEIKGNKFDDETIRETLKILKNLKLIKV